jgi:hypothetical protein
MLEYLDGTFDKAVSSNSCLYGLRRQGHLAKHLEYRVSKGIQDHFLFFDVAAGHFGQFGFLVLLLYYDVTVDRVFVNHKYRMSAVNYIIVSRNPNQFVA